LYPYPLARTWLAIAEFCSLHFESNKIAPFCSGQVAGRPGQIPAQLVGHALFYFAHEGDLVFDPMAGGGVVSHMCLAFGRKCCSFDLVDHPETRPEIEPFQWNPERLVWPVNGNKKPD